MNRGVKAKGRHQEPTLPAVRGVRLSGEDDMMYYTYDEVAMMCFRKPKTIKNLVCKYRIPHHKIQVGRHKDRTYVVISAAEVKKLRARIHGF